jgi:hypothetical protein
MAINHRRKEANLQLQAEREAYKLASELIEDMLEVGSNQQLP